MSIVKLDGGIAESHGEAHRQHLHLQLRSGQLRNGKRLGAHGSLHHLRNGCDFGFLETIPENRRVCGQDTHSQYTFVQYSLFTSAERTPRAWLKSSRIAFHLCAPEKNLSSSVAQVSLFVVASPDVHHEHTHLCSTVCSPARTAHSMRLAWLKPNSKRDLQASLCPKISFVIWCVTCLIHGCSLTRLPP